MNKYAFPFLLLLSIGQSGCALNPSSKTQPEIENNQNIQNPIAIGMARSEFITKVITPSSSKLVGDKRIDTFILYTQGKKSQIYGRAAYNTFIAAFIPFDSLKEQASIPESAIQRDQVIIQVIYDSSDRVEKVVRVQ